MQIGKVILASYLQNTTLPKITLVRGWGNKIGLWSESLSEEPTYVHGRDTIERQPFHLHLFGGSASFNPVKSRWVGLKGDEGIQIDKKVLKKAVDQIWLENNHIEIDTTEKGQAKLIVHSDQSVLVLRKDPNDPKKHLLFVLHEGGQNGI